MKTKHILEVFGDINHAQMLEEMPKKPGLYGLCNHRGRLCYVGIASDSLHDRIMRRHVGGDGNSHKYSSAYNAGYLWHDRKAPVSCPSDGAIAKRARREFTRATCRAYAIVIPGKTKEELLAIESQVVKALQPHLPWQNLRKIETITVPLDEIRDHVVLAEHELAALNRQHQRWMQIQ